MHFTSPRLDAPICRLLSTLVVWYAAGGPEAGVARGKNSPPPAARKIPETLNFANGLFRERRYELAAQEYDRFLKDAAPGPDANDARFGLANARLFQGDYAKARQEFDAFLKQAPDHPSAPTAWYRVGETAYMLGDLPAARQAFEKYTTGYPDHKHIETALPYLGDVCLRTNDLAGARRAYEGSLTRSPGGRLADRARFGLGRALALQGDADEALKTFDLLAEKGGKDWADRAWFQIGQVQAGAKRYEKAAEAFATVERLAPQSPWVAEARLNRAEALIRLDRRGEADPILRAVAAEAPQSLAAQAAFALGTSELEGGDAKAALADLDPAAERFAKTPMAAALVFRSAEAAEALGRADDARARFLRVAEADPKDPWADDALARAARLALDLRDHAGAAELAATFATRYPASPLLADVRLVSARAALAAGRPKEAIATLTASLSEDTPSPATAESLTYYLGLAYRADGQPAKELEVLDSLAKTPAAKYAANAQFLIGRGHVEARRYAEAVSALEKYLAAKPDGDVAPFALMYLIKARLELGEADAAGKALGQLAERFPKSEALAPGRVLVGESALAARDYDRAAGQFQLAATDAAEPALASRARMGLGWSLLESGKPAEAAEAFAAFLAAAPADDPLAPEAALAQARALEAAKQPDPALAAYHRLAEKYPASESAPLASLAAARLLVELKRPAEAADAYARFVKGHPDYQSKDPASPRLDALLAEWGWALIDADRQAEADKVFTRLLETFPDSPHADDARFNLAESANLSGNHGEVVRLLTPLVAEGSKASPRLRQSALYRLARTQAALNDWPAAAKTLDRLNSDLPDNPFRREARLLRAEVALEADDPTAAEAILSALTSEKAETTDPAGFALAVRRRRVQALLALKKWKEVVDEATRLRADAGDDPSISEVDYARGRALQQLARFDDARAAYREVIDARKGGDLVARAQLMIGETYYHQKDYHEAIRQFLKVDILYDAPTWQAAALLETGKAHEQLDQWADAAETYERLRSKFPDDPSAVEAKGRLDAARARLGRGAATGTP